MQLTHTKHTYVSLDDLKVILEKFFDSYSLSACQKEIWTLIVAYLGQEKTELPDDRVTRSDTGYFCSNIAELLIQLNAFLHFSKTPVDDPDDTSNDNQLMFDHMQIARNESGIA